MSKNPAVQLLEQLATGFDMLQDHAAQLVAEIERGDVEAARARASALQQYVTQTAAEFRQRARAVASARPGRTPFRHLPM